MALLSLPGSGADAFKPLEVANLLWACSKLGYTEPVALRRLAAAAVAAGPRMNAQVRWPTGLLRYLQYCAVHVTSTCVPPISLSVVFIAPYVLV